MDWFIDVVKNKYAVFSGRARRKEYWMFVLFYFLIAIAIGIIDKVIGGQGVLGVLFGLAMLLPGLGVTVRRLHDTGRTGWWVLIVLFPLIGPIALLVLMALEGHPGSNEYGENPKEAAA